MSVRSGQAVTAVFTTRVFATGVATNADSTPTGTLYVNGTANAASVTVTNITTGVYKAAVTLPTLAVGDIVDLRISATVSSIADNAVIWSDTKDVVIDSAGLVDANTVKLGPTGSGTAQTARDIGASVLLSAGTGTGQLDFTSGVVKANTTQLAGSATPVTNLNTVFNTDFATNYNTTNDGWVVKLGDYAHGGSSANTQLGTLTTGVVSVGAVTLTSTLSINGAVSVNALTINNAFTISGTFTAAGISNYINGIDLRYIGFDSSPIANMAAFFNGTGYAGTNNVIPTVTNLTNAPTNGDLTATMKASVNTEVDTALADINLDHLVKSAVDTDFPTTVHLNSVIGYLADNGTAASFDRTTDALEAIRDRGDAAWTTGSGTSTLTQADVRTAVGLASANLDTQLSGIQSDTDNLQTRIPAALVGGRMDVSVGAMAADVITASALADGAIDRASFTADTGLKSIWSGTCRSGSVATSLEMDLGASFADNVLVGNFVLLTGGTGAGQCRLIFSNSLAQDSLSIFPDWITTPDVTTTFAILPSGAGTSVYGNVFGSVVGNVVGTIGGMTTTALKDFFDTDSTTTYADSVPGSVVREIISNATSLDAAGVRAAVGLASANLDTQLGAIDDYLDTEVAAIKAKTDNLPTDPADASDIAAAFVTVNTKLDAIDDFVDTEVTAIKAKTDQLTFTNANKVDATATQLADNVITTASIADDAITDAKIAVPAEAAGRPTRVLAMLRRIWEKMPGGNKHTRNRTTGVVTVRNAADDGTLETHTQSTASDVDTETKGT